MPTDIQAVALKAVAEVGTEPYGGVKIQASKLVREATGCGLRDAVEAVDWAIEHPSAETLPEQSIVATANVVWMKREPLLGFPWTTDAASTDGQRLWTNNAITKLIQSGEATVLRVGNGA